MAVAQSEPGLADVCGEQPSWICQTIYDTTSHEGAARFSDVLMGKVGGIVLVLVVACIVNLLVRRAINRFTARLSDPASTETLSRFRRRTPTVVADAVGLSTRAAARARTMAHVLRSVSTAAIWSIATVTVLGELGINLGPLVASAGIAGVALGFGAQSLVEDVISGFFMLVEDQYGVGDIIEIGDVSNPLASGTVEEVNLRTTRIRDVNGTVWHVPNGIIKRVGNMSQQWARALVDVSVAHGTDVDAAQAIIKQTADALWRDPQWDGVILEEPEVWGVEQLTAEGITIRLVVKTRGAEQFGVTRELRRRLLMALTADDIDIGQTTVLVRDERDEDEDDEEVGAGASSAGAGTVDTVPGPLTR